MVRTRSGARAVGRRDSAERASMRGAGEVGALSKQDDTADGVLIMIENE